MTKEDMKRWGVKTIFSGEPEGDRIFNLELEKAIDVNIKTWGKDIIIDFRAGSGQGNKLYVFAHLHSGGVIEYEVKTDRFIVHA